MCVWGKDVDTFPHRALGEDMAYGIKDRHSVPLEHRYIYSNARTSVSVWRVHE